MIPEKHLRSFKDIAVEYIEYNNFSPIFCSSEDEARSTPVGNKGKWPLYFSESDTMGEKAVEVFAEDEAFIDYNKFKTIGIINAAPIEQSLLNEFLSEIDDLLSEEPLSLQTIA